MNKNGSNLERPNQRVLGMAEEQMPYPLSERGGCWFREREVSIHLGVERNFRAQSKAHPAFLMQDLDELEKKLTAFGRELVWDS